MAVSSLGLNFSERLALAVYDLLMRALQPLLRRKLHRRAKQEPDYGLNVAQRFGHYEVGERQEGILVWLHAVSLGETRAAALLLPALREAIPNMRLLLTHSTATGWGQGQSLLQAGDLQVWLPWDTAYATRQFLAHFKPRMGLLMETEVWPNLVRSCLKAGVPLYLLNARMSEISCLKGMRWSLLSGPAYRGLSGVLAQTPTDAQRLQTLGCLKVEVTGNLKFDVTVSTQARSLASSWQTVLSSRPVVMLASSREGEELLWLQALQSNPERWAQFKALGVLWLVVPRHPQRFDEVQALLETAGLRSQRRSEWGDFPPDPSRLAHVDVLLGDSLGEMQSYYLVSQMALLGGSFAPLGGQNLIEAAACDCPVIMGPHTFNFADAAELAQTHGAALRVENMQTALDQVVVALKYPQRLKQSQLGASQLLDQGRGAVARHVHFLLSTAWLQTIEGVA
jgi:3-deoxy-D-manno-octulosonic-acid transferase